MVPELLAAGVLILFGMQAPPELREVAIVHEGPPPTAPIAPGDVITLGTARYLVTGVGPMANANFGELGHIVIKPNGATTTELPGEVSVAETPLLVPTVGAELSITTA